jgi:hypothetical protein
VSVEVGLVVQSDRGGDLGGSVAVEEEATGVFDPLAGEIGVGRKTVCLLETADQVGGVGMQGGSGLAQGKAGVSPRVQQVP